MFYVSELYNTAPQEYQTPLQQQTYQTLEKLNIPFERVETEYITDTFLQYVKHIPAIIEV